MMKKIHILLILIFVIYASLLQSNPATSIIEGTVIDAETKETLPAVNVMVAHSNIGAATDKSGRYRIGNIPPGEVHLIVTMMGYKKENRTVTVEPDQKITVNFALESTVLEMGSVVITGTATPHLITDTPVRTEVIPRRSIERKQATNLAEALSFHTGIRVENNCQNCNFSQVRILGMGGKYSQILIDGDPVISSLASVYGLEHFPEEMVDQIEIVKGGGSALYGSGAVAGVINMITRRPITNQVRIKYLGHSTKGQPDQHVGAVAETVNDTGTSGAYVFGSFRKRAPYDHNGDGFSELGELKHESMGLKWYYKPFEESEFLASFHRIHEERRGGNKFGRPVHEADIAEWIEHWRSGGTVRWQHRPYLLFDYKIYYSFSFENRTSYYGGRDGDSPEDQLEALNYYGRTKNPLHIGGFQANYHARKHLLTAGVQHKSDDIMDKTAAETPYHLDKVYTTTGLFLQDNLHVGHQEKFEFVIGARLDKHSELAEWILSPRFIAKFNAGKGFLLRAAYSTGFKPPQTYNEDLHLCGVEGDQRIIRNAPDLKEERSNTLSTGMEYKGKINGIPALFSVMVFRTRLNDSFTEQFVAKSGSIERWQRVNSDGAQVRGAELDVGIQPVSGFRIRGGLTFKKSRYDSPHEDFGTKNFLRTPDLTGNLRLNFFPTERIDCFIRGDYIGQAEVPHEVVVEGQENPDLILEKSQSFLQLDLGIIYQLPLNNGLDTKINTGVKNVTNSFQNDLDTGPDRDPAFIYGPIRPRTFYFGLETTF